MNSYNISFSGAVDSGKSTLISVLKNNILDDGKGSARTKIVKHDHELRSGRTSCVSYNTKCYKNNNIFTFIDLAGHEKYLKNTMYGLNLNLHCMFLIISANNGISIMTKEHFNLARALQIPIIIIINKIDICPENIINDTLNNVQKLVTSKMGGNKKLHFVENYDLIHDINYHKQLFIYETKVISPSIVLNKSITELDNYTENINYKQNKTAIDFNHEYPVFFTSCKTGYGIDNLLYYLNNGFVDNLKINSITKGISDLNKEKDNIFIIQETYQINGVGIVFYGHVKQGLISKNDKLNIGPFGDKFYPISIKNVRDVLDNDVDHLYENQSGCILIKQLSKEFTFKRFHIRKGTYITSNPFCCQEFIARVFILHHPTTIKQNYQSTIHCGTVAQAAVIKEIIHIKKNVNMENKLLRTGDYAKVRFEFMFRPEYIKNDSLFVFRENHSKGIGKILSTM